MTDRPDGIVNTVAFDGLMPALLNKEQVGRFLETRHYYDACHDHERARQDPAEHIHEDLRYPGQVHSVLFIRLTAAAKRRSASAGRFSSGLGDTLCVVLSLHLYEPF